MAFTQRSTDDLAVAGLRLRTDGYAPLPRLLTPDGLQTLRTEAHRLAEIARRRDFTMVCTDSSPRHMTTLGGHVIERESALVRRLYEDPHLLALVAEVIGETPVTVADPLERYVLNILHRVGDTHGAHTDDHPYALVLFLEAPDGPGAGGLLEYVPRAGALADLNTGTALSAHHRAGDAYLLRSDTTAHRVTSLEHAGVRRTVLNLAYTTRSATPRSTPSARALYM
ncbi:hypothetical protein [Streptomyces sp. NPDC017991]|uniref:HalD/BesD family halogenase n=1 Tax=Streptomyces sp. NPDC017991 TaxID=3365026 RepID=UPI0037B37AFF